MNGSTIGIIASGIETSTTPVLSYTWDASNLSSFRKSDNTPISTTDNVDVIYYWVPTIGATTSETTMDTFSTNCKLITISGKKSIYSPSSSVRVSNNNSTIKSINTTIFIAFRYVTPFATTLCPMFYYYNSTANSYTYIQWWSNKFQIVIGPTLVQYNMVDYSLTNGELIICGLSYNGNNYNYKCLINGSVYTYNLGNRNSYMNALGNVSFNGRSNNLGAGNANIHEVRYYTGVMTDSEMLNVRQELVTKWT
jgi:hypothetical protein